MIDGIKPMMVLLTFVYGWGSDNFDRLRPAVLDVPMKGFHADINMAMQTGGRILSTVRQEVMMADDGIQAISRAMAGAGREIRLVTGSR